MINNHRSLLRWNDAMLKDVLQKSIVNMQQTCVQVGPFAFCAERSPYCGTVFEAADIPTFVSLLSCEIGRAHV